MAGFKYSQGELCDFLNKVHPPKEVFKKKLSNYSKCMTQKVGIAIALVKEAKYILMEEPTSGLDPKASVEFANLCKELGQKEVGIFMATHDILMLLI